MDRRVPGIHLGSSVGDCRHQCRVPKRRDSSQGLWRCQRCRAVARGCEESASRCETMPQATLMIGFQSADSPQVDSCPPSTANGDKRHSRRSGRERHSTINAIRLCVVDSGSTNHVHISAGHQRLVESRIGWRRPSRGPASCSARCTRVMSCASAGLLGAPKAAVFSPSTCSPTWKSSASASTASLQAGGLLFYGLLQYAASASRQTQRKSVAISPPEANTPAGLRGLDPGRPLALCRLRTDPGGLLTARSDLQI